MRSLRRPTTILILSLLLTLPLGLNAQYQKDVPTIPGLSLRSTGGPVSLFGIDLSKIDVEYGYSMQVNSFAGQTVSMGLLRSSFNYVINPQVSFQGSVGLLHSPFSSFAPGSNFPGGNQGFDLNNIVYSGEFTYRPKPNMVFQVGVSRTPPTYYNNYRSFLLRR